MPFVSKTLVDANGVEFPGLFYDAGGAGIIPVSVAVDRFATPVDFSTKPMIGGLYNDMRLGAGKVPPLVAIGDTATIQSDKYGVMRVSIAQDGREMVCATMTTMVNQQVFSNTGLALLGSMPANIDGRTNKITFDRCVNSNWRLATAAASTNATLIYSGASRLIRLQGQCATDAVSYVKIYDIATAPTQSSVPAMVFEVAGTFSLDLCSLVMLNGIAIRITRSIADNDNTAINAGDVRALNLTYAR